METKKNDLYRDTPVRYLGYTNEVGEAFRSIIGTKWVNLTYGIATMYVLADTADKSIESYKVNQNEKNHKARVAFTTTDTLIWQLLASVIIPGFTINRICAVCNYTFKKSNMLPKNSRRWLVTAIGLSAIPFIIKPIDKFVDFVLDESLRKVQPK
ncbi:mitochondrial fission process protein 1 [Sitophilus oryzae]|uniref:Mitochondrial fission process protein 1 n=1 Tax=Sitophilus oryzae TaxID=7048 RepID=A0A6J2X880_SITOR|nr:mitochondrial fission process protein 1 [Sitophilus oryzae]